MILSSLGDYQQARQVKSNTVTRGRRVLGDDDPDTLRSASNLGRRPVGAGRL